MKAVFASVIDDDSFSFDCDITIQNNKYTFIEPNSNSKVEFEITPSCLFFKRTGDITMECVFIIDSLTKGHLETTDGMFLDYNILCSDYSYSESAIIVNYESIYDSTCKTKNKISLILK